MSSDSAYSNRTRACTAPLKALLFLLFLTLVVSTRSLAITIPVTGFTASSYTPSAADVTYTYIFTVPAAMTTGDYVGLGLESAVWGGVTGLDFCSGATVESANITGNLGGGSFDIASANIWNGGDWACQGVTLSVTGGTISADSEVTVVVSGITNVSSAGSYYPKIYDGDGGNTEQAQSVARPFGGSSDGYVMKLKVVDPLDTAVGGADVFIRNSTFTKQRGYRTDSTGYVYVFSNDVTIPQGSTINDTYAVSVRPPSGSTYSAPEEFSVTLASGTTYDYTGVENGPVQLTRAFLTGRVLVPAGCTTCVANEDDPINDAGIELSSTTFDSEDFQWANADSTGIFRFGNIEPGSYFINFKLSGGMSQNYVGLAAPDPLTPIVVNDNGSVTYDGTTVTADNLPFDFGDIYYDLATKTVSGSVTYANGDPVTNAWIYAGKMMEQGSTNATSDEAGNYNLVLSGGSWMFQPEIDYSTNFDGDPNNDVTADWIYCGGSKSVSFADDDTVEALTDMDFVVKQASVTVTGRVLYPDETPLDDYAAVVMYAKDGCGARGSIDWNDGTFTLAVAPGTYTLSVQAWDNEYASPASTVVNAQSGTINVGTLYMTQKTGSISGRLWADANGNSTYDSGEGVGDVKVQAFVMSKKFDEFKEGPGDEEEFFGGANFAWDTSSTTDATKGEFTLAVTPGTWVVNVMADPGMMGGYSDVAVNYIYNGAPVKVEITEDFPASIGNNFKVIAADATIQGRLVDAGTGDPVTGVWGYSFAEPAGSIGEGPMMGAGMGAPISNGIFTIKVPAGSYSIGVDFPPESAGYTASEMVDVTAVSSTTTQVNIEVLPNNATVQVRFKNEAGTLITNLAAAEVFMENGGGGHQWRAFNRDDLENGYVNIAVSAGTWRIGYHVDPAENNYLSVPTTENSVTAVASQTVTKDITLKAADSTISGLVRDPSGNPLGGVWVSVDSRKAEGFNPMGGPMFMLGDMSDENGTYSIAVPSGTYQVAAFFPPEVFLGGQTVNYLNPSPADATVNASTATVNFTFGQSDATITGYIKLNGSNQGAFVTAYSNEGGYNEDISFDGTYTLNVTKNDTWFVRAIYEDDNTLYMSDVYEVAMGGRTTTSQNLTLTEAPFELPEPISTTFNCANAKKITLPNGVTISIPANAIIPSSLDACDADDDASNITITVTPTAQMSLQNKTVPVGIGYEIVVTDSNGAEITDNFNSNVTITIPYTTLEMQTALGGLVDESLLNNGYWDDSTSTWKSVDGQVLDTEGNTLTISTNHFTLYGILAASDPSTTTTDSSDDNDDDDNWDSGGVGIDKPYIRVESLGNITYVKDTYYYSVPAGQLIIKGTAHEKTKVKAVLDDDATRTIQPGKNDNGDEGEWDYTVSNLRAGQEYKFDFYAINKRGARSSVVNFYVTPYAGGTYSGNTPTSATTVATSQAAGESFVQPEAQPTQPTVTATPQPVQPAPATYQPKQQELGIVTFFKNLFKKIFK